MSLWDNSFMLNETVRICQSPRKEQMGMKGKENSIVPETELQVPKRALRRAERDIFRTKDRDGDI